MPSWWCHTYETTIRSIDSFCTHYNTITLVCLVILSLGAHSDSAPPRPWGGIRFALFYFFFLSLSPFFTRRWYALCVGSCKCINRKRIAPEVLLNVVESWGTGFDLSDHSLISSSSLHFSGIAICECSFIWLHPLTLIPPPARGEYEYTQMKIPQHILLVHCYLLLLDRQNIKM